MVEGISIKLAEEIKSFIHSNCLIVVVFLCLDRPYADWVALFLFIGASITDYIDGYLARKWSQQSAFGTMLDPIADKILTLFLIITLIRIF